MTDTPRLDRPIRSALHRLRTALSLAPDTDHEGTIAELRANLEFHGANFWTLVLAIIVASVGLNVNSTAVIIGAMLISPLMGPIVAAGAGLAIDNLPMMRRALRNVAIAASASVGVSAIYFALSPLATAQSELLARTRPTLFDVLIAIAGGCTGAIASSRTGTKGNAIPGVAIATALMPPLCTAGFGIANGNLTFVAGALYLFVINSLFIGLSTFVVFRLLRFPRRRATAESTRQKSRLRVAVGVVTLATILPSVFVAWQVIRQSRFDGRARRFVAERLDFPDRATVNLALQFHTDSSTISATLVGPALPRDSIEALSADLPTYGLTRTRLQVRQPAVRDAITRALLDTMTQRSEAGIAARDQRIADLETRLAQRTRTLPPAAEIAHELGVLEPELRGVAFGDGVSVADTTAHALTVMLAWRRLPSAQTRARVERYVAARLQMDSVRIVHDRQR